MKSTTIIPGYRTDHTDILFTFTASLARDFEYVCKVEKIIEDSAHDYYLSGYIENLLDVKLKCNDSFS